MEEFLQEFDVFIPILSRAYYKSEYCEAERTSAFAIVTKDKSKQIIPVRITDVELSGLLNVRVFIDLYKIKDETAAVQVLLEGLGIKEYEPKPIVFPGSAVPPSVIRFPGTLVPNNLPERNEYFSGRSGVFESMCEKFAQSGTVCLKQTITGLGGVGKTETAKEYAYRYGHEYNNAIWWVNAQTEMSAFNDCLRFAEDFSLIPEGVDEARKLSPEQLGKRLRDWLIAHNSWLFIFDNVENKKVIAPYISGIQTGHVIITTRDRKLRQGKTINIDLFTTKEAEAFMRGRLDECLHLIKKAPELTELVERLGYFPLALEQAAAYMEQAQKSAVDYLSMLDSDGLKPLLQKLGAPTNYPWVVTESLAISLEMLSEGAKQLLCLCSWMAPDGIPLAFFRMQKESFPLPLCEDLSDGYKTDVIVAELLNYSLVNRDGDLLSIHRLVQEIVRELFKCGDTDWLGLCLGEMNAAMPERADYGSREPRDWFELISAHAATVATYAIDVYYGNKEKETQTATLCGNIALGNMACARYSQALEWFQKELTINENMLGKDHMNTTQSYNNIASVYSSLGDYTKAMEGYQTALAIREKVLGKDHPDTATSYNNIAHVYDSLGDYPKALEGHQTALSIREKVLGKEHPDTAQSYNNIASVYTSLGDYPKALKGLQTALAIREKVLGKEHPDTAQSYNNIAFVYSSLGGYTKAMEGLQTALAIREKVLGKEHPDTAQSYNNVATVYASLGDYPKALEGYQTALAIIEKVVGKNHPDVARCNSNIATVYYIQGDYLKALDGFFMCYKIFLLKLGDTHPNTVTVRENMQITYQNTNPTEPFETWLQRQEEQ